MCSAWFSVSVNITGGALLNISGGCLLYSACTCRAQIWHRSGRQNLPQMMENYQD